MRELAPNLWVVDGDLRIAGFECGTRMTVVRLSDGRLWLHSPVPRTDALAREVDALGPVAFIVAPSKVHFLFVDEWAREYKDATVYGAPGLREKRADLVFHRELGPEPPAEWSADLDQQLVEGATWVNETVFLHRPSGTVLFTDLLMNFSEPPPGALGPMWTRLMGVHGGPKVSRMFRRVVIRDKPAVRASVDRILGWEFDRAVVTHGQVIERDARAALRDAYAWL